MYGSPHDEIIELKVQRAGETADLRAGETRRAPSWVFICSAFERACMILTGTNSRHAPSSSHLAKVYPTSTSMHLAWVADPFFSDFQKRSPLLIVLTREI